MPIRLRKDASSASSIRDPMVAGSPPPVRTPLSSPAAEVVQQSLENLAQQVAGAARPASADRAVHVLVVSSAEDDHRFLRHLFDHTNWFIHTARGCSEAAGFLKRQSIPVVLCDCELADGSWRDMLAILERCRPPSLLIVSSSCADDFLWAEVLNLGGYDVLMKPFEPGEVVRVISLAWLHWKNLRERLFQAVAEPLAANGA